MAAEFPWSGSLQQEARQSPARCADENSPIHAEEYATCISRINQLCSSYVGQEAHPR